MTQNPDQINTAPTLKRNAAQCLLCNDIIESTHRHDFKYCKCGNVAVDGGLEYCRRAFRTDKYRNLIEYDVNQKNEY